MTTETVGHVVLGNVIPSTPADACIARVAGVCAGVPIDAPALTVNRLRGSWLQAIVLTAQGIALAEYDVALVGGAENTREN